MILTRISSQGSLLGMDAPTETGPALPCLQGPRTSDTTREPASPRTSAQDNRSSRGRGSKGGKEPPLKVHKVEGGAYTHNRAGVELCRNLNLGTCHDTAPSKGGKAGKGQSGDRCAANPQLVHQCSKCLSNGHGASSADCRGSTTDRGGRGGRGRGRG